MTHLYVKYLNSEILLDIIYLVLAVRIQTSVVFLNPVWTVFLSDKLDGVYRRQWSTLLSPAHTLYESLSDANVD
jgi:hypothetical protein